MFFWEYLPILHLFALYTFISYFHWCYWEITALCILLYFVYATLFTYFLALLLLYCYAQEDTSSLKSLDVNVDDKDSLIAELRKQNEQLQKENAKLKQLYTTCVWLVVRALNSHNVSIRHSVRRD